MKTNFKLSDRYINQVITLTFEYADESINYSGYLIDFNDDWVLLKHNVVGYVVDGCVLLKTKHIQSFTRGKAERFKQKIFDLKKVAPKRTDKIPLVDLQTILTHLSDKLGIFSFYMRTSTACWLGRVKKISGANLIIDYLTPGATWAKMRPFQLGNIRMVEFNSDYINSLKLIAKKKW